MKSFFDLDSLLFRHYAHDYTNGNHGLAMTFFCLTVGLIVLLCALLPDKQKLVPGVLVVGGNAKHSIKANRERFRQNAKEMLQEGYKRAKGDFFYVPSPLGERLMIPSKYLEELKTAPIDQVDFVATFIEMFEGKYTTMGSRSTLHPRVVKAQLNHHLADVMPAVQKEIVDAFNDTFPACEDWTPVPVVHTLTQIVARVSSCMFGGTTLSHNREWVQSSIDFAIDGFIGAQKLKRYPEFLKPFAARFIPEIAKIAGHYAAAEAAAIPLLESRLRTGDKAEDLLYWMAEQAKGEERGMAFLASILLKVSFAAIHTSAAAPAQLIYDLCERPEIIETLRNEVESLTGDDDLITKSGFLKMVKMDSFMKESQRFNPLLLITFERVVHRPFTLSSGFTIPAHTTIGIPTQAITMDESFYPDPETFDAFRFARMREERSDMDGRAQYVASNPTSLSFGYGRHACPGRFFAAHEIKAIMAHLLKNYDMRFTHGQGRPQSVRAETQYLPDPWATVEFKRRI
ncbi:cytochrome P450 [Colletotrichum scovillei]|uniref:Cytochrome P450 n=1 Tax=Colletotrichum scovillei TaxID=1209932 RepID=A0A9P7RJ85_9PEZI|nr:cytochrome P450 [Colletotrichum scovillei]KAG7077964.1 cytochrome P450 [Colletotrichum scovillei]KAG7085153.1 cytochrome P450 [Colletotrichum scovillei]